MVPLHDIWWVTHVPVWVAPTWMGVRRGRNESGVWATTTMEWDFALTVYAKWLTNNCRGEWSGDPWVLSDTDDQDRSLFHVYFSRLDDAHDFSLYRDTIEMMERRRASTHRNHLAGLRRNTRGTKR